MSTDQSKTGSPAPEESFEDGFLGAEISVEDRNFGPSYPIVQWINGNPTQKKAGGVPYTGGFFISSDQGLSEEALKAIGFEPYTHVTQQAEEIPGFAIRDLKLTPIRWRRCFQVDPRDGKSLSRRFGWDEFDAAQALGSPRGVAHILVAIDGLDEPVLVSFRGMTAKHMMGQGKDRGVIPEYGSKIIGAAKRVARAAKKVAKDYPLCAFSLTVGPEMETEKAPKFTEVGSKVKNIITAPVWRDEPTSTIDAPLLGRLYVGHEKLAIYQDWHNEAQEWVDAWSSLELSNRRGTAAQADGAAPAADGTPGDNQVVF